jgi:hypothetical protein
MFHYRTASARPRSSYQQTRAADENEQNLLLRGTDGALRRLVDRTIVWTHVQFAVTEFGSPLIAKDSAPSSVR